MFTLSQSLPLNHLSNKVVGVYFESDPYHTIILAIRLWTFTLSRSLPLNHLSNKVVDVYLSRSLPLNHLSNKVVDVYFESVLTTQSSKQ